VRGFVQDDGHIFCSEQQIQSESAEFIDFLHQIYDDFGFTDVIYRLSTRPANRVGSDESWDKAEKALADALDAKGLPWQELPGEGAFYGPKIEFSLQDCIGRVWQCGTLQVDFSMPGRLDASYIDDGGDRQTPVMLHRAILGSFERFIGILIEHHEGRMPLWLAPNQVRILNITDRQREFSEKLEKTLLDQGFRAQTDLRNEKIGLKIREATLQKVPYMLVIGDKETESGMVSVRTRDAREFGPIDISSLVNGLNQEIATRGRTQLEG
jgi:threonyl-tRNA synthetase